jgi:hypothetical protein
MCSAARRIVSRERNVVRVDFRREPDPPAPRFPGAAALRELPAAEGGEEQPRRAMRA